MSTNPKNLTPEEEHALIRAEVRQQQGPTVPGRLDRLDDLRRRRARARTARHEDAADAGYDTWDDYNGDR